MFAAANTASVASKSRGLVELIIANLIGTTSDFCGTKSVKSPSCSGTSSMNRVIGYYEGWAQNRDCYGLMPEQIDYNSYSKSHP